MILKTFLDTGHNKVYILKYKLENMEMNMRASAKELRFHVKELLNAVSRGEEVIITYRGKDVAKLIPIENKSNRILDHAHDLFGIWREHSESDDVQNYVKTLRKGRY